MSSILTHLENILLVQSPLQSLPSLPAGFASEQQHATGLPAAPPLQQHVSGGCDVGTQLHDPLPSLHREGAPHQVHKITHDHSVCVNNTWP